MSLLKLLVLIFIGGRLIRFFVNTFSRSPKNDEQRDNSSGTYGQNAQHQSNADEEARRQAYRKWQEEMYRRYQQSQQQYQEQARNPYGRQYSYQNYGYNGQNYGGYQQNQRQPSYDPKLEEVRRMYGHPRTLDELDDRQRELRKKYHPDNNNGDSSMFILVDKVHDEIEMQMKY